MNKSYLVLSRKAGESITLQFPDSNGTTTEINIDILEQKHRVGIEAPRDVLILRHELTLEADLASLK
jgi:carbon storage regulator CsrA